MELSLEAVALFPGLRCKLFMALYSFDIIGIVLIVGEIWEMKRDDSAMGGL